MKIPKAVYWGGGAIAAGVAVYALKTQLDERRGRPKPSPYPVAREPIGRALEVVHEFHGPIPTGVTVSRGGRVFVCHPRWEDPVDFTVGELLGEIGAQLFRRGCSGLQRSLVAQPVLPDDQRHQQRGKQRRGGVERHFERDRIIGDDEENLVHRRSLSDSVSLLFPRPLLTPGPEFPY